MCFKCMVSCVLPTLTACMAIPATIPPDLSYDDGKLSRPAPSAALTMRKTDAYHDEPVQINKFCRNKLALVQKPKVFAVFKSTVVGDPGGGHFFLVS